jgi:hypothetical protein
LLPMTPVLQEAWYIKKRHGNPIAHEAVPLFCIPGRPGQKRPGISRLIHFGIL